MILGPREDMTRLPIFSFLIRCGGRFLHHSFIAALLNDLFGVEVRAGCACAGPYAFHTMGIDYPLAKKLEDILSDGYDLFRPGFVRVNFNYFIDEYTLEYILQCIDFVATQGLWFLPQYKFDIQKAAFIHRNYSTKGERHTDRKWLGDISYSLGEMKYPPCCTTKDFELTKHLTSAQVILESIQSSRYSNLDLVDSRIEIPYQYEKYRSFILPSEALAYIQGREDSITNSVSPFYPCSYDETARSPVLPLITNPEDSRKEQTLAPISMPKKLIKKVTDAISEFNMINEGDKILVCISGGKDSLTLLHVLKHISVISKTRFTIGAATVDPMTPEYDPSPLKAYLAELNIPYFYEAQPLIDLAAEKLTNKKSICSFCSRMKRGILYSCARREGYNVLALGQHLDDLAESFVMSVFNNGQLKTMKANYTIKQGDLKVIRPLVYVRERFTKEFAEKSRLPVIYESCPACFASPQERHRVKLLLASQEQLIPDLFSSILKALKTPVVGSRFSLMSCPVETESVDTSI
jgi:tRNA(Ile)-lysidine synthase TilS/MesJ